MGRVFGFGLTNYTGLSISPGWETLSDCLKGRKPLASEVLLNFSNRGVVRHICLGCRFLR